MNKDEFKAAAQPFLTWLSNHIDDSYGSEKANGGGVFHQWVARSNRAAMNTGDHWSCASLYGAYKNYYWKSIDPLQKDKVIFTFQDSEKCLEDLKNKLDQGIQRNDAGQCLDACKDILRWGGVYQWKVAGLIRTMGDELPNYLSKVKVFLKDANETSFFRFGIGKASHGLQVDSGTTKIYSLLSPDWAIYDGRVGAALGLLVRRWADEENDKMVPSALRFAWGYERRRNPNRKGENTFPMFSPSLDRFKQNLYLNWLLKFLLAENIKSDFHKQKHPMRALEAALFMLGYCVRTEGKAMQDKEAAAESSELNITTNDNPHFSTVIAEKFGKETQITIPGQMNTNFVATMTEQGLHVSCLGTAGLLPWIVFDEVEQLLSEKDGCAQRGNAMNGRLGDNLLPMDSVEGRLAVRIYGKSTGDPVFRRISPVANILVWAGLCVNKPNYLCKL